MSDSTFPFLGENGIDHSDTQVTGLIRSWDFVPSIVPRWRIRQAIETTLRRSQLRPNWHAVKPIKPRNSWTVYFMFCPDGVFASAHAFALARLRDAGHNVLVVCAARSVNDIPFQVAQYADALYWKELNGYDFSAYTLALREISRHSRHANVLVFNDSVFGPFTDLRAAVENPPWELTGYTASSQMENHIQSYAFILQNVEPKRMRNLARVMFPWTSLNVAWDVICVQETRFARIASKSMRVGAFWFSPNETILDPTLMRPIELVDAGFPFIKRSLLSKHANMQDPAKIRELLFSLGHPVD